MRYDHPDLPDRLGAEYALGTLRGPARRRYERLLQSRPDWREALARWEDRLHGLADTVAPVEPPARVWQAVEGRLGWHRPVPAGLVWWRRLALLSTTVALGLGVFVVTRQDAPPVAVAEARSALLLDKNARAGWLLTVSRTGSGGMQISVAAQPGLVAEVERDYELWALPPGGKPVSLGLLPQRGGARLTLETTRATLLAAGGLAVSVEPVGGSPTGQPTGEVRYQGALQSL